MQYMQLPECRLTVGNTVYTSNKQISAIIPCRESSVDTATVVLDDTDNYLYLETIRPNTAIQIDVKSYNETWTANGGMATLFKGIIRFPNLQQTLQTGSQMILSCDGAGYGLLDMVAALDYGTQSNNPSLDTAAEIITDATHGLIPKHTNKFLEGIDSGFAYTTTGVDTITGAIPYQLYPYKPIGKCFDDIADILAAIKAPNAGAHWRVDTNSDVHFKLLTSSQAGWSQYFGVTQADSTLYEDRDFLADSPSRFEVMGPEANAVVYYGAWRRPSSGDAWTENSAALWGPDTGFATTMSDEATIKIVGSKSIKALHTNPDSDLACVYPAAMDAAWDFSGFTEFNTPNFNFYVATNNVGANPPVTVALKTNNTDYYTYDLSGTLDAANTLYHVSIPIGPYYNIPSVATGPKWTASGTPNWNNINYIQFYWVSPADFNHALYVDGLHFGNAVVCRVARSQNATILSEKGKVKVIVDHEGKDDTLTSGTPGTTDTGLMARMAHAELLRLRKNSIVGSFTTPMLKDLLPGHWIHIHAKKKPDGVYRIDSDFRVTKITHNITPQGFTSTVEVTDDLTNSHARTAYENQNKIWASQRPDTQDRAATSQKMGDLDIRVARLTETYS